eukprot:superscaffoldBa00010769_g24877
MLFSGSEPGGVPLRARASRSPARRPNQVKIQPSRRRIDPVGLFPASVCSRDAVIERRSVERKSLRGGGQPENRRHRWRQAGVNGGGHFRWQLSE